MHNQPCGRSVKQEARPFGYARVSTGDQHFELQLEALQQAGCQRIFCEKVSGARHQRPQWLRLLEQLRVGDTVVVWKLDRLA